MIISPNHWKFQRQETCYIGHYFEFHYISTRLIMAPPVQPSAQPNKLPATPTEGARAAAADQRRARAIAEKAATMEKLAEPPLLTGRDEIMDVYAKLHEVLRAMKNRSAGGGDKQGRYKKADTARRHFILTRGLSGIDSLLPSLRCQECYCLGLKFGKIPSEHDMRMLSLPLGVSGADKVLKANGAHVLLSALLADCS